MYLIKRAKLFWGGIILVICGLISFGLEKIIYDYIDENGIVQESFFLPLAFLLGSLGFVMIAVSILCILLKMMKN